MLALAAGWIVQRYFASTSGQALAAIKTNETRLEYLGISAKRVFWGGYVLAAALCGLGGTLFALTQGLVTPEMEVLMPYLIMVGVLLLRPEGLFSTPAARRI